MNMTWIREMKTLAVNKSLFFFISCDHGFQELAQAKTAELKEGRTGGWHGSRTEKLRITEHGNKNFPESRK